MPNRLLREGFLDSERIDKLSTFEECLYTRLLLASDDAGRLDGRLMMVRANCFPLRPEIDKAEIESALAAIAKAGLLVQYEHKGSPYIQLTRVQRYGRGESSKFPWRDGSHFIKWVEKETAGGRKQYVSTSIDPADAPTPSAKPAKLEKPARKAKPKTKKLAWSKETGWENISENDISGWSEAYPEKNIDVELKKMHQWLLSNPAKSSKTNWRRFITNWLSRGITNGTATNQLNYKKSIDYTKGIETF